VDCASPLEVLISPDGARLYVLCQQSEEIRALDAASYAVIKSIEARPVWAVRLWKAHDG
jgi:YVTN family beta-propeller protein